MRNGVARIRGRRAAQLWVEISNQLTKKVAGCADGPLCLEALSGGTAAGNSRRNYDMRNRSFRINSVFIAAAAVLIGGTDAQGQERGLYGELRGGAAFLTDSDVSGLGGLDGIASSDVGFLVEGAIGYALGTGLRGEFELGYRQNEYDKFEVPSVATVAVDGNISGVTVMGNAYYDFDLGGARNNMSAVTPFVGAGLGAAFLNTEVDSLAGNPVGSNEDDTVFAWQVIAGLSYEFSPTVAGTLSYNYFATSDASFDGVKVAYGSHDVLVGIRMGF